jgi:Zn-dependent oligopeptidase
VPERGWRVQQKPNFANTNRQIAALTTQFQQTVLKASSDSGVIVKSAAELDGQPLLADLKNRVLRERIFRASVQRGNGGVDFDEVTTMFHEFGPALHDMFSSAVYPTLAGTNVPADFAEYPSQFNEMWAREPKVLAHFARHYQTSEPMRQELFDRVLAAERYGQGYALTESYLPEFADTAPLLPQSSSW